MCGAHVLLTLHMTVTRSKQQIAFDGVRATWVKHDPVVPQEVNVGTPLSIDGVVRKNAVADVAMRIHHHDMMRAASRTTSVEKVQETIAVAIKSMDGVRILSKPSVL